MCLWQSLQKTWSHDAAMYPATTLESIPALLMWPYPTGNGETFSGSLQPQASKIWTLDVMKAAQLRGSVAFLEHLEISVSKIGAVYFKNPKAPPQFLGWCSGRKGPGSQISQVKVAKSLSQPLPSSSAVATETWGLGGHEWIREPSCQRLQKKKKQAFKHRERERWRKRDENRC